MKANRNTDSYAKMWISTAAQIVALGLIVLGLSPNGGSNKKNEQRGTSYFVLCTYDTLSLIKARRTVIGASCSPHHKTQEIPTTFHK